MPSRLLRRSRRIGAALVLAAVIGTLGDLALRPAPPPPIVGMVRTTEIKIAPEVSGRIAALPVRAGEHVAAGAVVATLSSPELAASVEEARAAVGQARAIRDHVYAGVRQEQVDIAAREVEKATADLTLAEEQFRRTSSVAGAGYASKQNLDAAQAAVAAARANLVQMQSQSAAAQHGATAEERASADAAVTAAEASLTVLERRRACLYCSPAECRFQRQLRLTRCVRLVPRGPASTTRHADARCYTTASFAPCLHRKPIPAGGSPVSESSRPTWQPVNCARTAHGCGYRSNRSRCSPFS